MKRYLRFLSVILAVVVLFTVFLCVPSSAAVVSQLAYVSYEGNVKIRADSNTSSDILGYVSKDYVTVTGKKDTWFAIEYNGISGYMHPAYVDLVPTAITPQQGYVNYENVKLREQASTARTILNTLTNVYVTVTGIVYTGELYPWYAVTYEGVSGFMYGEYIDLIPNSTATLQGYVNGSGVRIRSSVDTSSLDNVLGSVTYDYVTITETVNTGSAYPWYKVEYNGISGYMYGQYITIVTTEPEPEPEPEPDPDFETQIAAFPESYKPYLRELHAQYPNWIFRADNLSMTYDEAVKNEDIYPRKLVNLTSNKTSWFSMGKDSYNWSTGQWSNTEGGWTGASTEVIKYYMDPRNFLNANDIYMFMQQGYDSSQTIDGINTIIKNTFLANGYSDAEDTAYGGSYANVILEAARQSGVSAYVLASTIILEQGVNGASDLISGTTGYGKYFNFFNIRATGSTSADVLANGLAYAKAQGWSTRSAAIIGGAKSYATGYIKNGQDTYFYKNFDLLESPYYTHQYAQSIYDSHSSSRLIRPTYKNNYGATLIFKIPVYASIPETVAEKPAENSLRNNYYLMSADISGFSMYNYNYSLSVTGDKLINVTPVSGASLVNNTPYKLTKGSNLVEVKVKAETGYTNSYYLTVEATQDCFLCVSACGTGHSFTAQNKNYIKSSAGCDMPAVFYYECSGCGLKGDATYTSDSPLGHSYSDEWTVDVEVGFYNEGSKSRHCTVCDGVTDVIVTPQLIPLTVDTLVSIRQRLLSVKTDMNIDANGDGAISILDYIILKKASNQGTANSLTAEQLESFNNYLLKFKSGVNSDVNYDGRVNILDLIAFKKMLAAS